MIDRAERFLDGFDRSHGRRGRTGDHEDFDAEMACCLDFRIGRRTAAILGNDRINAMRCKKSDLAVDIEGAAIENIFHVRNIERRIDGIDAANKEEMMRRRLCIVRLLASGRQEDAASARAKRSNRLLNVSSRDPLITRLLDPFGPAKGKRRNSAQTCSAVGVGGDAGGKGMCRIDEKVKASIAQERREAVGSAETANANRNRLIGRFFCAAGKRQQDVKTGLLGERLRQSTRFGRSAQYQSADFCHV